MRPDPDPLTGHHTHRASLGGVRGIPQFVTDANANAACLQLEVSPA
ncbi:MAG: hypothetical protein KF791_13045 [Verrucomicrobiae bacterium]|nr:hypothetical protein [Verrucomicrobiae bacterium]